MAGQLNAYTTIATGKVTVTTAGTRVPLASVNTPTKTVTIRALSTNTGIIYVGDVTVTSGNGFQLSKSESVSIDYHLLDTVYIDSSVNGEGITYIWLDGNS